MRNLITYYLQFMRICLMASTWYVIKCTPIFKTKVIFKLIKSDTTQTVMRKVLTALAERLLPLVIVQSHDV